MRVEILIIGSKDMTVGEMLKQAFIAKGMRKKDVAAKMGWSPQNLTNRLKLNTIDAEEWIKLSKILGYEVQMVDMESGQTLKPRKPSSGPRVVQMIDGYTYDTEKADSICRSPKLYGGWFELFKDIPTGRFYTVAYLETGNSSCMALISNEDAKKFYQDCMGTDEMADFPE